jgi:hypothetical protein
MGPSAPLLDLLTVLRVRGLAEAELPGLLHLLITRRIGLDDGTLISAGLTWQQAAEALVVAGWPAPPPGPGTPRVRWLAAARRAGVDSPEGRAGAERLARRLREFGYTISAG